MKFPLMTSEFDVTYSDPNIDPPLGEKPVAPLPNASIPERID